MLEGRAAIITGASRGLGYAVARRLHSEGANVLLVARSLEDLLTVQAEIAAEPGGNVHVLAADLTRSTAPAGVVGKARQLWGAVDIVVNNAAVIGPMGPFFENE